MAEKDQQLDQLEAEDALHRVRTAGSITITPELFEKLYLSPQNQVKGDLRLTFANPTPYCLAGFLLALTPLSCQLMGWQGAPPNALGAATIGTYFFFGGLLMVLGSVGEFLLGNTFPCIVFGTFGAFWLTIGATLQDGYFGAITSYAQLYPLNHDGEMLPSALSGSLTPGFAQSFAFFFVWMGVLCVVYFVCSLRTNVVFVLIFITLIGAFPVLAAALFYVGHAVDAAMEGNMDRMAFSTTRANNLILAGGAIVFVTCALGWYIFTAIMLAAVDFPFDLPLGDLSTVVKGARDRKKASS